MELTKKKLDWLRSNYTPGTRVKLISMEDPYTKLPAGLTGTVMAVDDVGTIHVNWDNGSSLGIVYGEDHCRKIPT